MNQRLVAACVALPMVLALFVYASLSRLPYATYAPGGTIDVLGVDENDAEIIQVQGHRTYRDDGQLRMTTVSVSPPQEPDERGQPLLTLLSTWADRDDAVYPYDAVHQDDETAESSRREGAEQMATSQDSAVEVALSEMGIDVPTVLKVAALTQGLPAEDALRVGDIVLSVDGVSVSSDPDVPDDRELVDLITGAPAGEPLRIGYERDGAKRTAEIVPVEREGRRMIGITPGYDFEFPFQVNINISPQIGGPSAGLMFSLAVYDTLTPGSLTGGRVIAGTGEIAPDGTVGPIGGIQQKIAGARQAGAQAFLVPAPNCADAVGSHQGDMRLIRATTMHEARLALESLAAGDVDDLPSCDDAPQAGDGG